MYRTMVEVATTPFKWISTAAAPMALAVGFALGVGWSSRRPSAENPAISEILSHWKTRAKLISAMEAAKAAKEIAEKAKQYAKQNRERARRLQEDADRLRAQVEEKIKRWKVQIEEEAIAEDAVILSREAEETQECDRKIQDDAERTIVAVGAEVKKAQQAAEAQRLQAEAAIASAERTACIAMEKAREADLARQKAEECLEKGIQPVVMPSLDELAAAKRNIQYSEGRFHCAITGTSGSGKSSLVNAFRGLHNRETARGAAAVGTVETTLQTTRYPSPNSDSPFVWYDIPGAGTLKCPDWLYFNNQGLYVFDCIVVLTDNRFIMTDIAILTNARRFNIPTYIVRSKADQHIQNTMMEIARENVGEDEEKIRRREKLYEDVRKEYIDATKRNVEENLRQANLPDQRVYNVSNTSLLSVVRNEVPENTIDEVDLIKDLVNEAYARRNGGINLTSWLQAGY